MNQHLTAASGPGRTLFVSNRPIALLLLLALLAACAVPAPGIPDETLESLLVESIRLGRRHAAHADSLAAARDSLWAAHGIGPEDLRAALDAKSRDPEASRRLAERLRAALQQEANVPPHLQPGRPDP